MNECEDLCLAHADTETSDFNEWRRMRCDYAYVLPQSGRGVPLRGGVGSMEWINWVTLSSSGAPKCVNMRNIVNVHVCICVCPSVWQRVRDERGANGRKRGKRGGRARE